MPKVFIINDSGHDYSGALNFGELVVLTQGIVGKLHVTYMYRSMCRLLDSEPDDYILMCGPSIMQAVACSIFAYKHGGLNLLIYKAGEEGERGQDKYMFRRLNLKKGEITCP